MSNLENEPGLELMRRLATSVPAEDRPRYAEAFELLANKSPALDVQGLRNHSQLIVQAHEDLREMLRRWAAALPENETVTELLRRYDVGEYY
jgi:hypothetical protein